MKNQNGFTLIEILIVVAIISVLAAVAIPQFYPFKTRAYDADAKANLHNVFLSCKGYWALNKSNNPCVLSTVSNNEYGFIQSDAVEVTIENNNNTETDFIASASHIWSANSYAINFNGVITSVDAMGTNATNNSSGSGSSGSGSSGSGSSGSGSSGSGSSGSGSGECEELKKGKAKKECEKQEKKKKKS